MEADIVSNAVYLQSLEEFYKRLALGEHPLNAALLLSELDQLERKSQYRDFFSLFEIAENCYLIGLFHYRLAIATKNLGYFTKAIEAFRFVLHSNYRTQTCTTEFLEWLIYEGSKL